MAFIAQGTGYLFLIIFGCSMITATYAFARWKRYKSKEGFLVASRQASWFTGGVSIAASWIWAPALFISSLAAYENGLAGIFWFTIPNIIALGLFAFLGPRIRERMPRGFTLPQYIGHRFGKETQRMYLIPFLFYQIMAVTVQLFAGGNLVTLLTGIPLTTVMPILALIALLYTLISGLEASMVTDIVQMTLIIGIGAIIIPWTLIAGGSGALVAGVQSGITHIFDPGVAFGFGIVTSIGLLAGAISDQQYWQRSFAVKKEQLRKAFLFGAGLFGIVPIALSLLGFLAANSALGIEVPAGVDASMIGVQTVATLLPQGALLLFIIMLLAGLCSTLDSGLSAASSLWVTDVHQEKDDAVAVASARWSMFGTTLVGLLLAYVAYYVPGFGLQHLWWFFNSVAACLAVPTVLSLYWPRLTRDGVLMGVLLAFFLGLPLFVYGNIISSTAWVVGSYVFIIVVSTGFCLGTSWRKHMLV